MASTIASRPSKPSRARSGQGRESSDEADRKSDVLTHHDASASRSIAGAIVIKDGEPFCIFPPDGLLPLDNADGFGFYHHDTRFLSGYELRVAGSTPGALAASAPSGNQTVLALTNEAIDGSARRDGTKIAKQQLAITWTRRLDGPGLTLRDAIEIANHGPDAARFDLELAFSAGFEDLFTVRGLLPDRTGSVRDPIWSADDRLDFVYDGADEVVRSTHVTVHPAPDDREGARCHLRMAIPGRDTRTIEVTVRLAEQPPTGATPRDAGRRPTPGPAGPGSRRLHRSDDLPIAGGPPWNVTVRSESLALDMVLARSLADLLTLRDVLDGQRYYAAGVPWFSALFGRDSLIAAYQTLAFDPAIAAETLRLLAGRQGDATDAWRDEEPGRILHELRVGELARLDEIPHTPYYGTIDATPLFLIVLAEHAAWTGSLDLFEELRPNVERALAWIDGTMRADPSGYLAYDSTTRKGLVNQGWKDSGNAIVDASGGIATPPIALAEVQGYVYRAKAALADLYRRSGDADRAARLEAEAADLQERFERDFWSDDLGCHVLALAAGAPCAVATSNAGQVLWSGITSAEHARTATERLFRADLFAGWGIRTLSSDAVAYNPVGYHLGTIWPHDNGIIAEGLRRYGADDGAERLLVGLVEAATDFDLHRLPECMAGFDRDAFGVPVRYPLACHPQAWAAGAIPHLLTASLGLRPDGLDGTLHVVRPRLPDFVRSLEIRGLAVGRGRVDLAFRRSAERTVVSVLDVQGEVEVDAPDDQGTR